MKQPAYSYMVRLPENPEPGRRYPAVFTLHGRGSNEEDLAALTAHLEGKFILVHIRGDLPAGAGYQYYELQSIGNPMRSQFDAAAAQLEELICYVTEQHPVDPARRYVLGFSQGAILAMTLALVMGSGLKGIIALNGYVPGFVKPSISCSLLIRYPYLSPTGSRIIFSRCLWDWRQKPIFVRLLRVWSSVPIRPDMVSPSRIDAILPNG